MKAAARYRFAFIPLVRVAKINLFDPRLIVYAG